MGPLRGRHDPMDCVLQEGRDKDYFCSELATFGMETGQGQESGLGYQGS